jgi:hypothetical protein
MEQQPIPLTADQQEKYMELMQLCKSVDCFEYEGYIFLGSRHQVLMRYVTDNPSDKFFIWLQNNIPYIVPDVKGWPEEFTHSCYLRATSTELRILMGLMRLKKYTLPNGGTAIFDQPGPIITRGMEMAQPDMVLITPAKDNRAQRDELRELLAKDNNFQIRVKLDNHSQIQFNGHIRTIDELGGFRVFHRELKKHERKVFEALIAGYGFYKFEQTSDATSTVILPNNGATGKDKRNT